MRTDTDVLIVGAGPTGLVLACELLSQGLLARVIDKSDGAMLETRAVGMHVFRAGRALFHACPFGHFFALGRTYCNDNEANQRTQEQ